MPRDPLIRASVRSLIARLARRARDPALATDAHAGRRRAARPPLDEAALRRAEAGLGHPLAPFLRALYGKVGNGGFGPGYGILGLVGGARDEQRLDALSLYEENRRPLADDPLWAWPERLLPLANLGCGMFFCADAVSDDAPMVWFEPNPHVDGASWDDAFFPTDVTFRGLLESWARGDGEGDAMKRAWMRKNPGEAWED